MDDYIQISKLNDFIFCPFSLYFHAVYEDFSPAVCHRSCQTRGKIVHQCFDNASYSTAKKYLQGADVYSDAYGLCGKIDLFNTENGVLIERKNKITRIYDGYFLQLYGQHVCLSEMGHQIKQIFLYSLSDNRKYSVGLPAQNEFAILQNTIQQIRNFDLTDFQKPTEQKCLKCIYRQLCFA